MLEIGDLVRTRPRKDCLNADAYPRYTGIMDMFDHNLVREIVSKHYGDDLSPRYCISDEGNENYSLCKIEEFDWLEDWLEPIDFENIKELL